jgi:hypothetical protein
MNHLVLLGDSIFDNARYVPGNPAVSPIEPSVTGGAKIARAIVRLVVDDRSGGGGSSIHTG